MKEIKYYLVLEKRHGDYALIDINKLDITTALVYNEISSIDMFTKEYTEIEIKEAISRSNMVNPEYLNGNLKIISDLKHNLTVVTKEIYENVVNFQNESEEIDKNFKNKLYGIYKKIVEKLPYDDDSINQMLDRFKKSLREEKKEEIMMIMAKLPYFRGRLLYIAISMEQQRKKEANLRKLEKLNAEE